MKIKIPLAFKFIDLNIDVTPYYSDPDHKYLVPNMAPVKMAYHGYNIELTLGALKSVVDAAEKELAKLKG